jgi:hypothetical protein
MNCERCDALLIEIDYYGARLTGCVHCNVWRGEQFSIQLPEEDLEALRSLAKNGRQTYSIG